MIVALSAAACSSAPTPDPPTSPAPDAPTASEPTASSTAAPQATRGSATVARFSPCLISDDAVGAALGLDVTQHYESDFGNQDEHLCAYQTDVGTVLEIYILPLADHRTMAVGGAQDDQENRRPPEEQPIVVDGATDARGYLAFPGIDVRFQTERSFVLLASRASSDREGLDKTVAVANLIAAALSEQTA
ncbi:hypothetical protein LGT39_04580 [Demequina sp. TTPB684]|uniref:hypothetical protein n=1 Tax=unclassified Demequina TaxID=2620311 RepID=UPI001CF17585|nr:MULTISPECIES: hypothetical protein [unclassified Demequina]MCB2412124.1 hypothetical protein [Demequina sp. TTPB684]UPU88911.1 hypothetical protein LGT36_003045 [Demequina sp. TMPB413]